MKFLQIAAIGLAILVFLTVRAATAVEFVDWVSIDESSTPPSATGTLFGNPVTFSGAGTFTDLGVTYSVLDGTSTDFSNPAFFSPALTGTDLLYFFGPGGVQVTWTIDFGQPVKDPIFHFWDFANSISGFSATPEVVSSDGTISFDGLTLTGSGLTVPQGRGTLRFPGTYHR